MSERDAVRRIFGEALAQPAEARAAYLSTACAGDAALLAEVESLLASHERVQEFLGEPTADLPGGLGEGVNALPQRGDLAQVGTRIGRYKLLQLIGEGGFGVVFMAEQDEPIRRRVALKVIKLGMDTKATLARFDAERQALAMMDHPNIARVFDAGETETGRPYFVMELVKGIPITEYCDQQKLDTKRRLELFIEVCLAVQHAHQKGIIHRDIKPSNVLVTMRDDKPVPKVIDFGIAKATQARLTERTLFTEFQQMIGTPAYMSPEQAQMNELDADTRSDIYSLGVLLYELLTGTTPFEKETLMRAAYGEIQRIIREVEPPKPSTRLGTLPGERLETVAKGRGCEAGQLSRLMRGDLDWIIMKCLEKDRTRRYETANGLARDLQRHLVDEPVEAGPPSMVYRLRKVARRNRGPLAAAAVVTLTLFLAVVVSTGKALAGAIAVAVALFAGFVVSMAMLLKARRAEKEQARLRGEAERAREDAEKARATERVERERAQRRFEEVQKLARVLMFELHEKVKDLPGATGAIEMMVRTAQRYLEVLSADAVGDVALLEDLAQAYKKVGDIQGNAYRAAGLGDFPAAMVSYQKSLALHQELLKNDATSFVNLRGVGMANSLIGSLLFLSGDAAQAMTRFEEGRKLFEEIVSHYPKNIQARMDLAECIRQLSDVHAAMGEGTKALEDLYKVKDLYFRLSFLNLSQEEGSQLEGRVASVYMDIAYLLVFRGRTMEALKYYNGCLTSFTNLFTANPSHARARRAVAVAHMGVGSALCCLGDATGSAEEYGEAVEALRDLARGDPGNAEAEHALAVALQGVGDALAAAGKHDAAIEKFHEAGQVVRNRQEPDMWIQRLRGGFQIRIAHACMEKGEASRALALYESVLNMMGKPLADDAANAQHQRDLAGIHCSMGRALVKLGRRSEGLEHFEKSLPPLMKVIEKDGVNTTFRKTMAEVLVYRGEVLVEGETFEPGIASVEKGKSILQELVEQDPDDAQARRSLCDAEATLGLAYSAWARKMSKDEGEEYWWRAGEALVRADQELQKLEKDERITMVMPEKAREIGPAIHAVDTGLAGRKTRQRSGMGGG